MLQAFVIQKDRFLCTFYFYSFYMTQAEYYAMAAPFTSTKRRPLQPQKMAIHNKNLHYQ